MSLVHPSAIIASGARLDPSVSVGPYCVIGPQVDLTYSYDYLGAGPDSLAALAGPGTSWRRTGAPCWLRHKAEEP